MADKTASYRFRWVVLAVSFLTSFFAFASLQTPPPLMPVIMEEFQVSYAQAGLLMTLFSLPGILAVLCGVLADRYGAKSPGVVSILCVIAGSFIVANSSSFEVALVGRLVAGVGAVFISVITLMIIPQWFSSREMGTAMGIYGINMPVAVVVAFNVFGDLGVTYGWRFPFYVGVVLGVAVLAAYSGLVREGPLLRKGVMEGSTHARDSFRTALTHLEVWKVGLVWLLFNVAALSFMTWGPALFAEFKGIALVYAAFLSSLLMLMIIPFAPFFGWISDRLRKRRLFLIAGPVLMTFVFLVIPGTIGLPLLLVILILGVCAALVPAATFALSGELLGPRLAGTGFGILMTCLNIGIAVGPVFIGHVRDVTGSLLYSFAAIAAFSASAAVVAYFLRTR